MSELTYNIVFQAIGWIVTIQQYLLDVKSLKKSKTGVHKLQGLVA